MKCPKCGYDKIQPNFVYCPKCHYPLKAQNDSTQVAKHIEGNLHEKGFINRAFSRWTYERANADPYAYAIWAYRNPNDNKVFLQKWHKEGHDLTAIQKAIAEANRARHENPTTDRTEVDANIIDSTRQTSRRESNNSFVQAVNSDYTTDAAALVRNKAIWKLQPGELARHIAPDEWCYVSEHLEGIVIEEGTSAIIYVDGQEVAQMGSGMYEFDDKHQTAAEIEAERRKHETQGFFSRLADGIYRFITGHKREENTQQREERRRRVQQIIGRLKKDTNIDVFLKSDRVFPAVFGNLYHSDSPEGYKPFVIQSRYLDLQVGVSMQMQIGDFKDFIANYLAGRKSVTIDDVVKSADFAVFSVLRFQLRDIEVTERGLDEVTFNAISAHLKKNLPNVLHGVVVIEVLDIATSNEQLTRFRQVEGQLYCSEQEYDFLLRTNEFRNRIASEENDQKIREARSEQDLRVRLNEINKDKLLHDDEMEQFVSLLMNQKVIREATNKADLDKAMLEIERNRLISQEEFDIFSNDLENRRFNRDQVSEQLRVRSLLATALSKMEVSKTLALQEIRDNDEISDAEWAAYRKERARDAEDWDLEATIYGRKYVLDRQKLIDEAEKRRLANEAAAASREGEEAANNFRRTNIREDQKLADEIKEAEYRRKLREQEDKLKRLQQLIDIDQSRKDREMEREQNAKDRDSRRKLEEEYAEAQRKLEELKELHEHDLATEKIRANKDIAIAEVESGMSADQLVAKNVTKMDATAQAKFAESFSHLTEAELAKKNAEEREKLYQQMLQMAQANNINIQNIQSANSNQQMQMMMQMLTILGQISGAQSSGQQNTFNSLIGAMQSFATTRFNDAKDIKDEYKGQMHHEESRADEAQKQALNSTTRVKVSENTPNAAGGTSVNVHVHSRTCPGCGQSLDDDMPFCPYCGQEL